MNKLKYWRIKRGLTIDALSSLSGIARETISRIENGRLARPLTIGKLATALNIEPNDLSELIIGEG